MIKKYQIILDEDELNCLLKTNAHVLKLASKEAARFSDFGATLTTVLEKLKVAEPIREARTKQTRSTEATYIPNLCPEHPTYSAERPPRTDCEGHWEAYKKMHPMEYTNAKRKFNQAQRRKKN